MDYQLFKEQASIAILSSLIETTEHPVLEVFALKELYAKVAVMYAEELRRAVMQDNSYNFKSRIQNLLQEHKSKSVDLTVPEPKTEETTNSGLPYFD